MSRVKKRATPKQPSVASGASPSPKPPAAFASPGPGATIGTYITTSATGAAPRPRVLVADDTADMRQYIEHLLQTQYDVTLVGDGEAALAALRTTAVDLVLVDAAMPRGDGYEVLRAVRADPALRSVPVILLSSRAGEDARIEGLERGADDYLLKPFSARELLARVGVRLEMARLRDEAAQALRERDELLHAIIDNADAAIFAKDLEGRFTLSNRFHAALYGSEPDRVVGKTSRDFGVDAATNERHLRHDRAVIETGRTMEFEEVVPRPGGAHVLLSVKFPLRDAAGVVTGVCGISTDITERKRWEESLEQRVAERTAEAESRAAQLQVLASRLVRVEELERRRIAQVLHDNLQQCLVAAKMKVGALVSRIDDEKLRDHASNARALIDQAILVSRSLTSELAPPLLYESGMASVLEWLGRWMGEKHQLEVTVDVRTAAEPATEDVAVLLFQAVREALFNVVKHSGVGQARVELDRTPDGLVRIQVEDSGVGFDPTAQREHDLAEAGFGLFSIRERLGWVGGQLEVSSAPGQGTTVTIVVPERTRAAVAPPRPSPELRVPRGAVNHERAGDGSVIRVLLADDHPVLREGLAGLLREQPGFEVVGQAGDGQAAIDMARELRPDVVVMDVTMPRLNGIEATRRITAEMPDIRVIGLSMHEQADVARAFQEAGAAEYLLKDSASETLIETIRRCAT